jgi:ABC-2 type transport system ATP-binding protein
VGDAPIRTEQLRKLYGTLVAVDGLDLEVRRGEFFGLLGPNGAGKSTTIGMLTTTVLPTDGRALVSGLDVRRRAADVKRQIGVVSQANTLDRSLTVWENLYYHGRFFGIPRARARTRADELLERFSLTERADAMVFHLSGGLAQRLMLARALVHEPQVLFLDEPTSGIDPQTRINLWSILDELHRAGQTTLLTTHYMEEADELCERIAIIDHGKALAVDTPAELKSKHGAETVITLTVEGDPAPLAERAERLDGVRSVERDDQVVRVHAARSEGVLVKLVQEAAALDLSVRDASSLPPSLETVFLNLTGREYRE